MYESSDLNLTDQEVDPLLFKTIDYEQIPKLFVGFPIKNKFEYNDLHCNNGMDIAHLCGVDGDIEPIFLRGTYIEISPFIAKLINQIDEIQSIDTGQIFNHYVRILKQFNLSCNSTYAYLMDGLFPIDVIHLNKITDIPYEEIVCDILHQDKIPWFFKPELKIFLLIKSNTFIYKKSAA
jgi:hypothetical protein